MARSGPVEWGEPTGRPLVEPPMFNYEDLVRENHIGSDARLRRLFAKDITLGYRWRDAFTEAELDCLYIVWASDMYGAEADDGRREFYGRLTEEIYEDTDTFLHTIILREAFDDGVVSHLAMWEYLFLDEDEGTTGIKRRLTERQDLFFDGDYHSGQLGLHLDCQEAFKTYGYLAPPDFLAELKERYEEWYLTPSSEASSPGTEAEEGATPSNLSPAASPSEDASDPTTRNPTATSDLIHSDFIPATSVSTASQPSSEHPPVAENAALKKRIAEFELQNNLRKRTRQQGGTTEDSAYEAEMDDGNQVEARNGVSALEAETDDGDQVEARNGEEDRPGL